MSEPKRYLVITTAINSSLYGALLLFTLFDMDDWLVIFFGILLIIDIVGLFWGWQIMKNNRNNRNARLGFIINLVPVALFIIYSIFFAQIKPA